MMTLSGEFACVPAVSICLTCFLPWQEPVRPSCDAVREHTNMKFMSVDSAWIACAERNATASVQSVHTKLLS